MNLIVETMFGSESKFCASGVEVRYQQPTRRARGEDIEDGGRELFEVNAAEVGLRSQVEGTLDAIDNH